jgi:hypothetical protein
MDTKTRAVACSPSIPGHARALEPHPVAQSPALPDIGDIPAETMLRASEKGRRIVLIAGIVLGLVVTMFGPLLLGGWPVGPL